MGHRPVGKQGAGELRDCGCFVDTSERPIYIAASVPTYGAASFILPIY